MNQVLNENEQLLEQVINNDIVNIVVNSSMDNASVNVHECKKCLKLKIELLNKKDFNEKETYDKIFKRYTTLEQNCISLEVDTQLNQGNFQRDNSVSNQSAPNFDQYFELNELKARSQEKDTVITKLKEIIKSLSGNVNEDKVKKDIDEIETINIELDHWMSKLIAKNKHLKQTYKQFYDSIKPTRVRSKEQCDALINQVNQKSVEISDLNANFQKKGLIIAALRDELRKLKKKALVDNAVTTHTIIPEMLTIDMEPLAPRLLNNRTAHSDYLRLTQEQAVILREVVEQGKSQNPLNNSLDSALKSSTSASRSRPLGNTKKDKIQRPPSSTQKNKVEAHHRTVKSGLRNKNCVAEPKGTTIVQHSKLNANSELIYVKCNGCMLFDNHDLCVLNVINDVNARSKSKSVKKTSKSFLSKASKTKSWLWHRRLSHLNFGAINHLARYGLVRGLPKLKFEKDHLCSACAMGKSKKKPHKPNSEDTNQEKLYLLHMDLCGPMCVASVNEKKYILVIVDDYSRFTWVGISHETSIARSPQQNSVVERRNPTKKAFRIYNRRTRRIIETIHVDFDELTTMASEHGSLEPALHEMTPATIGSRIVPNPPLSTSYVQPSRTNWDILFQTLFDELLNAPPSVDLPALEVIAPITKIVAPEPAASTGSLSSTTIDQDAPSPSNSQTSPETRSHVISIDV
uniref:Ribonuclease H-like domain-containing protein n=1 Tax=Tanacetum cinerariifolium TaxID=118510 RepID=A0A699IPI6_TANCI|nr:ribonuclease H-like domain-containing protein [Tanacetum cinerariifolium]